jgi:hypothetical protein
MGAKYHSAPPNRYFTAMWRWLARLSVGLSMGLVGLLLIAGILLVIAGAFVFYRFITG